MASKKKVVTSVRAFIEAFNADSVFSPPTSSPNTPKRVGSRGLIETVREFSSTMVGESNKVLEVVQAERKRILQQRLNCIKNSIRGISEDRKDAAELEGLKKSEEEL